MDVDDDDECMNAAAAHAAFVMTVSAASMYCLLRHAQHARDINIHKLHPLPEKIGSGRSADFLHSGTGYIEIAVFVPCRFQSRFQSRFSVQWNTPLRLGDEYLLWEVPSQVVCRSVCHEGSLSFYR